MVGTDIAYAAQILKNGGLVAMPTETVYGLAANALDVNSISRVFEAKNRPHFDPLICHFPSIDRLKAMIPTITSEETHLLNQFSPGPLTLLLPRPEKIPELVTSGSSLVAVRISQHPMALALLDQVDFPLAAPSANPFGYLSPTRAEHVVAQLGNKIEYILDGGPCAVGVESTVVQLIGSEGIVLRQGGITLEMLQDALPELKWSARTSQSGIVSSPGMLTSHYAPRKPLHIMDSLEDCSSNVSQSFFIGFNQLSLFPFGKQVLLSPSGSLAEAAANLFKVLHEADDSNYLDISAILFPDSGLGRAINDRLKRAAAKRP